MTRKPTAFRLDDPRVIVADAQDGAKKRPREVRVVLEPEAFNLPAPVAAPLPARKRVSWGALFWSALGGLLTLGIGLATTRLIEDLYARAQWLGTLGLALAAVALLALLIVCGKEVFGLIRLASIERLRSRAEAALASDDRDEARAIVRTLSTALSAAPALARVAAPAPAPRRILILNAGGRVGSHTGAS